MSELESAGDTSTVRWKPAIDVSRVSLRLALPHVRQLKEQSARSLAH